MIVKLDENNYFTGSYAKVGLIDGGIEVYNLPPDLTTEKLKAWKFIENTIIDDLNEHYTKWEFDTERYNALLKEKEEYKKANPTLEEQVTELKNAQATTDEMLINLTYDMIMLQNNL